jgi:hypothetical protein
MLLGTRHRHGDRASLSVWCRHRMSVPAQGNEVRTRCERLTTPEPTLRKKHTNPLLGVVCLLTTGGLIRVGRCPSSLRQGYVRDTCKKVSQPPYEIIAKSRWGCNGSGCTIISSRYCPNRLRCSVREGLRHVATSGVTSTPSCGNVTSTLQLAVDRQVEQRKISREALHVQLGPDRPNVARPERWLRANELPLIPRGAARRLHGKCLMVIHRLSPWLRDREHAPARLKLLIFRLVSEHSCQGIVSERRA